MFVNRINDLATKPLTISTRYVYLRSSTVYINTFRQHLFSTLLQQCYVSFETAY
jgi:hypothetical protein